MTSLGNNFVTPVFNSEAAALLDKKLRCKASAKRPKNAPVEAALATADESSVMINYDLPASTTTNTRMSTDSFHRPLFGLDQP